MEDKTIKIKMTCKKTLTEVICLQIVHSCVCPVGILVVLDRTIQQAIAQPISDIYKVANSRLGRYRRSGMTVASFIISKELFETKIKDSADWLNPFSNLLISA